MSEFEIYTPALEPYLGAARAINKEEAERLARTLESKSGLVWQVREVVLGQCPAPIWSPTPTAITVEEARSLAARHGQDRLVLVAWNATNRMVNVVTAGSSTENSKAALDLGCFILRALGVNPDEAEPGVMP